MDEEVRTGVLNTVPEPYRSGYEEKVMLVLPLVPSASDALLLSA